MGANPVVHFEMGYFDRDRMKKFYQSAFGWKMQQMDDDMGNYVIAETAETGENGRPTTPGQINGGFYAKSDDPGSHPPSIVIAVDDIQSAIQAVKDSGGQIAGGMNEKGEKTMEPTMIPGVGLWTSFIDTEKNRVSLLQPKM